MDSYRIVGRNHNSNGFRVSHNFRSRKMDTAIVYGIVSFVGMVILMVTTLCLITGKEE